MKDIAIFGAGGFGRETACLINKINQSKSSFEWNLIGFFDDNTDLKGKDISHFGVCLGDIDTLNKWNKPLSIVISVGNPIAIKNIVSKISNPSIDFPNIIHPDFVINDEESFKIGKGNIIQSGCSVSCNVSLGNFNVLNGSVVFGHDCNVGNYNTFMPAIRVSGGVNICDCNFFGVGSIILQQIKIGDNIRLAAGSVLMTKPKDGKLYMGNPAKKIEL
ncbi:MAG: serine acetyltransferase [Bacteroidales bacterium]|nr:serine acetyltransferase [Bacteroidales bacterium]